MSCCAATANDWKVRSQRESELQEAPERRRAFLAGQNEVAMGADSVVDLIEGVLPVLGPPAQGSVLWQLADAWKARLAQATGGAASYLGQTLAAWAKRHNEHPDLSSRVQFQIPEGAGTLLLTCDQEQSLSRILDGLDLRGLVTLSVVPGAARRPPGGPIRLQVGEVLIVVPAGPDRLPRPYDPGPAAFVMVPFLMLADMVVNPLHPGGVVACVVLSLVCGWWAHGQLERRGHDARPAILVVAIGVAVVYAAIANAQLINVVSPTGIVNYPVPTSLDLLGLLGGYYWDGLLRPFRLLLPLACAAVLGAAWLTHPRPQNPYDLVLSLPWFIPLGLGAWRFSQELNIRAGRYADKAKEHQHEAMEAAYRDGRTAVIELARTAAQEAQQRLAAVSATLPPRLTELTAAKLHEVERRLPMLSQQPE